EVPPRLTSRRPDLPVAADAVLARALAKAPADRFSSCREFSAALRKAFGLVAYDSDPDAVPPVTYQPTEVAGGSIASPVSPVRDAPFPAGGQRTIDAVRPAVRQGTLRRVAGPAVAPPRQGLMGRMAASAPVPTPAKVVRRPAAIAGSVLILASGITG